jgi:hypothetical protein
MSAMVQVGRVGMTSPLIGSTFEAVLHRDRTSQNGKISFIASVFTGREPLHQVMKCAREPLEDENNEHDNQRKHRANPQ